MRFAELGDGMLSAIQLRRRDFVQTLERAIAGGASPPGIDLEITESLIMEDIHASRKATRRAACIEAAT